jgi:hypothetical protein
MKPQLVCIDLPGETVECWRSTDKVKVVLRKHRDVIFDLKISTGRKYTVESSGSDFYDANKKRLIAGGGKQRISFSDGQRLHLWIGRNFKGELLLKSEGKLLMRVEPNRLDAKQYGVDPSTKPDPIIVLLGNPPASVLASTGSSFKPPRPPTAANDEECALVCVAEGTLEGIPEKVWKKLESGGGTSGLVDLDPNDIATRNWLLAQLGGAAAYVGDNWDWLKSSIDGKTHTGFKLVKAKVHYVRGKIRYYFSGYSKNNAVFGPGGFGPGNDRVLSIFGGTGKLSSMLTSTAKGLVSTFKSNALVNFIFSSATTMAEWKNDVSKDGYDLAGALFMNVVKALLSTALTAVFATIIIAVLMLGAGASVSILAVAGITIVAGTIAGYTVDIVDKKLGKIVAGEENTDGISSLIAKHMRESVQYHWNYLKNGLWWNYEESAL